MQPSYSNVIFRRRSKVKTSRAYQWPPKLHPRLKWATIPLSANTQRSTSDRRSKSHALAHTVSLVKMSKSQIRLSWITLLSATSKLFNNLQVVRGISNIPFRSAKVDGCVICNNAKVLEKAVLKDCDVAGEYVVEKESQVKGEKLVAFREAIN